MHSSNLYDVKQQGPISLTNLSWATYQSLLDLSLKTDLSLLVKLAPGTNLNEVFKSILGTFVINIGLVGGLGLVQGWYSRKGLARF